MLRFNEMKATQAAAKLLQLRGGRMHYIKLIKLLYFADRQALLEWGRPITTDSYVSMNNGPVLSRIYDLIMDERLPGDEHPWGLAISGPFSYQVELLSEDLGDEELSDAELRLLERTFERYGHLSRWQIIEIAHTLPEWTFPDGSSKQINFEDILAAGDRDPAEIVAVMEELANLHRADQLANL